MRSFMHSKVGPASWSRNGVENYVKNILKLRVPWTEVVDNYINSQGRFKIKSRNDKCQYIQHNWHPFKMYCKTLKEGE